MEVQLDSVNLHQEPTQIREDIVGVVEFIEKIVPSDWLVKLIKETEIEIENLVVRKISDLIRSNVECIGKAWYPFARVKPIGYEVDSICAARSMIKIYRRYKTNQPVLISELATGCLYKTYHGGWDNPWQSASANITISGSQYYYSTTTATSTTTTTTISASGYTMNYTDD